MEIERKYRIMNPPADYRAHPSSRIEQGYLCTEPVVRVRRDGSSYYLTYKSKGLLTREEHNLPLTEEAYLHLRSKCDGLILEKTRYRIPMGGTGLTIELDEFHGAYEGLILAEVEFPDETQAMAFEPPDWFGEDVTFSGEYQNSRLSRGKSASYNGR